MLTVETDIKTVLTQALTVLKERILVNMRTQGAWASGRTGDRMTVEVDESGGRLVSRGTMPFSILETGRRKGKVPYNFEQTVLQWAHDKHISIKPLPYKTARAHKYTPQERGELTFANAVKWCMKNGSRNYPMGGTVLHRQGGRDTIYSMEIPKTIDEVKQRLILHVINVAHIKTH